MQNIGHVCNGYILKIKHTIQIEKIMMEHLTTTYDINIEAFSKREQNQMTNRQ